MKSVDREKAWLRQRPVQPTFGRQRGPYLATPLTPVTCLDGVVVFAGGVKRGKVTRNEWSSAADFNSQVRIVSATRNSFKEGCVCVYVCGGGWGVGGENVGELAWGRDALATQGRGYGK